MNIETPLDSIHKELVAESRAIFANFARTYDFTDVDANYAPESPCNLNPDETSDLAGLTLSTLGYDAIIVLTDGGESAAQPDTAPHIDTLPDHLVGVTRQRVILNYLIQAAAVDVMITASAMAEDIEDNTDVAQWVYTAFHAYMTHDKDTLIAMLPKAATVTGTAQAIPNTEEDSYPLEGIATGVNYPMLVHEGVKSYCETKAVWCQFGDSDITDEELNIIYEHAEITANEIPQTMAGLAIARHAFDGHHPASVICEVASMSPDEALDWCLDLVGSVKSNPYECDALQNA